MRRSRTQLLMRAVIAVLAVCLVVPAQAFAALEDDPTAVSSTNPNWPNGQETWWRDGWGNSLYPNLAFQAIPMDSGVNGQNVETLGFYYWVTRGSVPDTATLDAVNVSIDTIGAMHEQTFDLAGLYADPGLDLQGPGSIEGDWVFWICFYNRYRASTLLYGYHMNYDGTPPSGVADLKASAMRGGGATTEWTETSRRYVTWTPAFDALSGVGVYRYELNGKFIGYHPGALPGQYMDTPMMTLDVLPPGKNKITITPIDRATNAGPASTVYAYVDPDVPVIKLTAPTGGVVGPSPTVKATATDKAGVRSVKFYVNGKLVQTDLTAPYQAQPSLSSYDQGTWIKFSAVVEDMFGHKATATKSCKLDKVAPNITKISDTPDPFYPVLQDRYKDSAKMKFTLNEKANVYLRLYNSKDKLIREIKVTRDKGDRYITWNGKDGDDAVKTGTFYYRLVAKDVAGNVRYSKRYATHIRDYEIIRISSNAVKVIPR